MTGSGSGEDRMRRPWTRTLAGWLSPRAGNSPAPAADSEAMAGARTATVVGVSLIGAAAAAILLLWGISFYQNRQDQAALLVGAREAKQLIAAAGIDLVEVRSSDPGLEDIVASLDALRNLPQGYAARRGGEPSRWRGFGLYQAGHSAAAVAAYREGLRRILLPRLLLRLERFLKDNAANPELLPAPLKVYLTLGGEGPLDPAAASAWIAGDWAGRVLPGANRAALRARLDGHLRALLEDRELTASWTYRRAPLDATLIADVRSVVQTLTAADRAYIALRERAAASGRPWRAADLLGEGDDRAFANGVAVRNLSVPFLYTRAGYERIFASGLGRTLGQLNEDLWTIGAYPRRGEPRTADRALESGVAARYTRDYIAAWSRVIAVPQPAAYINDPEAFGAMTRTPSPLKMLLLAVRRNTALGGSSRADQQPIAARFSATIDPPAQIAAYFRPVHDYVGDGRRAAPIDEFVTALKFTGSFAALARLAGGSSGGALLQAQTASGATLMLEAGKAPPQLQGFVVAAARRMAE